VLKVLTQLRVTLRHGAQLPLRIKSLIKTGFREVPKHAGVLRMAAMSIYKEQKLA
jgi:hypothetical protein